MPRSSSPCANYLMNLAVLPGGRLYAKEHEVAMKIDPLLENRFLREPEVHMITGLSRTTRWRMERRGEFPCRRILSPNAVGWLSSEIEAWMAERIGTETA